ncbi:hypothetical protein BHE90_001670 [Fusarium euwallaceae]|uniref:Oxidoreductase bli-4, mitochondrial n=1 Tax=Fusarium euwallaceae TaxID=1147111 RepID=A0A430M7C3_9HYPO|nr:hypothetical protein BHE90_001670 [Fusarium euwallaceae]
MSSLLMDNTIAENFGGPAKKLSTSEFSIEDVPSQAGKVGVVTGGSEGIGYGITHILLSRDIKKLYILSMSEDIVNDAKKSFAHELGQEKADRVVWIKCDLSDWAQTKKVAEQIKDSTDRLDILVNNAGRGIMSYELTDYGVDRHMAVNHFGHVILTTYLLPLLKKSSQEHGLTRIVMQSSNAHQAAPENTKFESLDELNQDLGPNAQYGRSKLANLLYSRYFNREVTRKGFSNLIINATHPGFVSTRQSREHIHEPYPLAGYMVSTVMEPFKKDQFEGAMSAAFAATATQFSGEYLCCPATPELGSHLSQDHKVQENLMELTRKVISDKFEPFDDRDF